MEVSFHRLTTPTAYPGGTVFHDVADENLGVTWGPGDGAVGEPVERFVGEVIVDAEGAGSVGALFVVLFPVPADSLAEFDDWFGSEHARLLTQIDGWARARLLALDDHSYARMAVHELADTSLLDSEARADAGATPWCRRVIQGAWTAQIRRHVLTAASDGDQQ